MDRIRKVIRENYGVFLNSKDVGSLIQYKWCKKCSQLKPPRAHHCSICGKCVLRMDHHCPWVGACVGIRNHKLFILFMFYSVLSAIFALSTMGHFLRYQLPDPVVRNELRNILRGESEM